MQRMPDLSRRSFVRIGASAAALGAFGGSLAPFRTARASAESAGDDAWRGLKVGIATYSYKELSTEEAVRSTKRLGVSYASIKDFHLPLQSTKEQRREVARMFRDAGITLLSCGVVSLSDDEGEVRNAFEYARDAGIPTIVCKPTRASLSMLDGMVKEFDIRLAIHNHGPEDKVWPSPYDAWEVIQSLDERIGLCIDVGHTIRCGVDPAESIRKCAGRLYDVHLKDLESTEGRSKPTEIGRGVLDTRSILQALLDIGFAYHVGLEYEKDLKDPIPGVAESIGYTRGMLSGMGQSRET